MPWTEIEEYSRWLAITLPSIVEMKDLQKQLGVEIPKSLDARFQKEITSGKGIPFYNLYLEILISWSLKNERKNSTASLQDLLSKYGVQFNNEMLKTVPPRNGKLITIESKPYKIYYNEEHEIDEGGSNRVYKGTFTLGSFQGPAAIKKILHTTMKSTKSQELEAHGVTPNPFIVTCFHIFLEAGFVYIAMERAEFHLKTWLDQNDPKKMNIVEKQDYKAQILKFLHDVCLGLKSLHLREFLHRDLNPKNVLICKANNGELVAKLSDFGISRKLNGAAVKTYNPERGTWGWRPPEVIAEEGKLVELPESYDMFPLGLLIFFVASNRKHLFSSRTYPNEVEYGNEVENNIKAGKINWGQGLGSVFHVNEIRGLVDGLIMASPEKRTNIYRVLAHPIFWDDGIKLNFVQLLNSDFTSNKNDPKYEEFKSKINDEFNKMPKWKKGWKARLCKTLRIFLADNEKKYRYDEHLCTSLVTCIADKKRHYDLILKYRGLLVPNVFGQHREFYDKYYFERFSELVPMLYELAQNTSLPLSVRM